MVYPETTISDLILIGAAFSDLFPDRPALAFTYIPRIALHTAYKLACTGSVSLVSRHPDRQTDKG